MRVRVLGVDPGFANLGWCVAELAPPHGGTARCLHAGVLITEKSAKKNNVHSVHDNIRRTQEIARFLAEIAEGFSVKAICAESMSFPPNASVAAQMAMAWGVLAAYAEWKAIPMVASTPQQVKLAVAQSKSASKDEVAAGVRGRMSGIAMELMGLAPSKHEHAYDAAASILAANDSDVLRTLRQVA